MICSLKTAAFDGIEAKRVEVQVSLGAGMPGFVIVGLPDKAINESKERVRAVLTVLGVEFPREHITVNLKPVDLLKEGAHFDLPIAMGRENRGSSEAKRVSVLGASSIKIRLFARKR